MAEKYTEVNFAITPDSPPNGIFQIRFNGEGIFIKQNKDVIIPRKFLDVLKKHQEMLDQKSFDHTAMIQYPYRIIRKNVSKKEYESQISHTGIL